MKQNVARELLWPDRADIVLRIVFLNVGQGASTIVLARDRSDYKSMLIDINLDAENKSINVPQLVSDLLDGGDLDVFVNTHPHDDHLNGLVDLADATIIKEIWHSGHKPGKKYRDAYDNLNKVIKKVKDNGGSETILIGSRQEQPFGDAFYYILAPAEYVSDDVENEDQDTRYRRIHEQCSVIRLGYGKSWVIIPGDADRDAFEKHITNYHENKLSSVVLTAPHHGSRSFFKHSEKDEPYLEGLKAIDPDYVIISSPTQTASKHNHPHNDALKLYEENAGKENVLHTGQNGYSFVCDIYDDGSYSGISDDKGQLAEGYPIGKKEHISFPPVIPSRIDDRPMGWK